MPQDRVPLKSLVDPNQAVSNDTVSPQLNLNPPFTFRSALLPPVSLPDGDHCITNRGNSIISPYRDRTHSFVGSLCRCAHSDDASAFLASLHAWATASPLPV